MFNGLFGESNQSNIPVATSSFTRDYSGNFADGFSVDSYNGETMEDVVGPRRNFSGINSINYYQIRKLSRQLFTENLYAAGLIDRMVTNVVNDGLKLEADPSDIITEMKDEEHVIWTDKVEKLFSLWASSKSVSVDEVHDLSGLEKIGYTEKLIEGDILKITKMDKKTFLPKVKYISGRWVQTAINSKDLAAKGNRVLHGVEIDKSGKHIAYHVVEENKNFTGTGFMATSTINFKAVRILAKGRTSNRDTATLEYASPPPNGLTRGFPLLMRMMQSLAQVGRYATLELKAAEVNAAFAMWVEKTQNVTGTNPLGGAALKTDDAPAEESDPNKPGKQRVYGGVIANELAYGEKPHSFSTTRPNVNFAAFKKTILEDIALSIGMPPEVFLLKFENSFSASRQATVEFRSVVVRERNYHSKQFNKNLYGQWLFGMVLRGKIIAKGYIDGFKIGDVFEIEGWQKCRWVGFIKQNVDILKEAKAYKEYIDEGILDREQASADLTGTSFSVNVKRLKKQNILLAEARDPLLGEINTSISRVEGKKDDPVPSKDKTQPAQRNQKPKRVERKTAAIISEAETQSALEVVSSVDFESVDENIDEMDLEEKREE